MVSINGPFLDSWFPRANIFWHSYSSIFIFHQIYQIRLTEEKGFRCISIAKFSRGKSNKLFLKNGKFYNRTAERQKSQLYSIAEGQTPEIEFLCEFQSRIENTVWRGGGDTFTTWVSSAMLHGPLK